MDGRGDSTDGTKDRMDGEKEERVWFLPFTWRECTVFFPIVIIFAIVAYVYATVRGLKDVFMINRLGSGSIYCAKVTVLFFVVFLTYLYTKIAKSVDRKARFNIVVGFFLVFFVLVRFIILPYSDDLRWDAAYQCLHSISGRFDAWWQLVQNWHFCLLYNMSEAWGVFVMNVLFWSFANAIISSKRAKTWYFYFFIGAALGTMLAGEFMRLFKENRNFQYDFVIFLIVVLLFVYNVFEGYLSRNPDLCKQQVGPKKKKAKLSFFDSVKFLIGSKYLRMISYIVFGYYTFIALIESVWKGLIGQYKSSLVADFISSHEASVEEQGLMEVTKMAKKFAEDNVNDLYGIQSLSVGLLQLFLVIFVAGFVSKRSWKFVALFTPVASVTLSGVFFLFLKSSDAIEYILRDFNMSVEKFIVLVGLAIVVFVKTAKYVFFDTSKERAYIPLDEESKVNGKAAIDATGSRLGKGFASIIISFVLIPVFGDLVAAQNVTFILISTSLGVWLYAVVTLSPEYEKKVLEAESQKRE